ncbi:hypothetical protein PSAB6_30392 [Paraburkholderia sabiae]|nr:hypothetical protein PSAB6_30392 [Paraburkholderia sabiae]
MQRIMDANGRGVTQTRTSTRPGALRFICIIHRLLSGPDFHAQFRARLHRFTTGHTRNRPVRASA